MFSVSFLKVCPIKLLDLEKIADYDSALHYFVLVATFRLPDKLFEKSLKELTLDQNLVSLLLRTLGMNLVFR